MGNTERVLMLCGKLGPGGTAKVVLNVTKHLLDSVDDVSIAYLGGRDDLVSEFRDVGVRVVRLGDGPTDPRTPLSLWRLVSSYRPTVIHTHMVTAGSIGRVLGRIRGVPVVSTIHTPYDDRSAPARLLDLLTSPLSSVNVPVSNAAAASLPSYFGFGADSTVVHNCIDAEHLRERGDVPWDELVWNDGISRDQPIIANVARFDPKKRREDLVRALPDVLEEFPDAALVFTGHGDHRRPIERLTRSLGVQENTFFVGNVPNPYSVYRHADVVALPSVSEGFSISMLEAMAFAKPIVATDIPPFREALGPDYPLVPTRDPPALAGEITRFLRDPERAERAATAARDRVERKFSGRSAARSYLDIYRDVSVDFGGKSPTNRPERSVQ